MDKKTVVEYKSFFDHINQGGLEDVTLYGSYGEHHASYSKDGNDYLVGRVFGHDSNPLLQKILDDADINYLALSTRYEGPENTYDQSDYDFIPWLMVLVPLVLLGIIFVQALVIRKLLKQADVNETRSAEQNEDLS